MSDRALQRNSKTAVALPELRQRLWLRLFSCSAVVETRIREKLKEDFDSTLPRFGVMAALARAPEGLTMTDLARAVRVSSATITGIIAALCAEGFATRNEDPHDKRIVVTGLTRAGHAAFARIAFVHGEWINQIFADLNETQVRQLLELLSFARSSISAHLV